MNQESKKKRVYQKGHSVVAGEGMKNSGGNYFCDYSPRYEESYDIYEKARNHTKKLKAEEVKKFRYIQEKKEERRKKEIN